MKKNLKSLWLMLAMIVSSATAWADNATYAPVQEVNFRTAAGNTGWNSGYPKNAADDGNVNFEGNYQAGIFALQQYTVADLQNASKLVLTMTAGSGVDALRLWAFPSNDWSASSSVDDMVNLATQVVGIAPRSTEGTPNDYLVKGTKIANSNPAQATWTISGTALTKLKSTATTDGTFTLMLTDDKLTSSSSRKYQSSNSANQEAYRPTLVATIETPSVINKTTGVSYSTLTEAFNAAVSADQDAELQVYEDQTLSSRLTWNKAHTLTITPMKNITIKGHRNGMWFLANVNDAVLNIGGGDYTITMDGQSNTFEYDVAKYENKAVVALTNVVFQNFNLNTKGHLVGSKAADGQIVLDRVTVKNCQNPYYAFFSKVRVTNDRLVLKGYLNIDSDCEGTALYVASETKSSGTTGRIKVDDAAFTASNTITIFWGNTGDDSASKPLGEGTKAEGIVVVIGTSADNAGKFALTDSEWMLSRKQNGDLIMAKPATPTAKIGDKNYASLVDALADAASGDVITLLADQELSARVNVKNMNITIDGQGQYAIKRAAGYTNGLLFLTQKPDEENETALTLQALVLDGASLETTAALIEASNNGTTTLKNVTVQNVTTTANAAIINKGGGKLVLDGVTFANITAAKAAVFEGTAVTLKGQNTIPNIYVEKQLVLTAENATATTPIELITEASRQIGLLVAGGTASQFTNASFRLSQQMDGIYAMPLSIAADYVHPGLLHTADDIALAKSRLDKDPFKSAYARLEATSAAQPAGAVEYLKRMDQANWQSTYPDYSNFTAAATDARLAYQLALRYQLKGSTAAATAAVNILNDWARNNKGMLRLAGYNNNIPDPNEYLICIQAHQFANAAELLRNYEGWQAADFQQFQNWIRTAFADVAILFLDNHHGNENALHYWMNWDMAALTAMYSVGVLCNDKALVDYALNYTTAGAGTGAVNNAIVATVQDPDSQELLAQCQESGRDQGHATLDVSLLGAFCKMAQSQGTDLFTPYKALEMAEYVGKYNLMTAEGNFVYDASRVPFTGYTNGEVSHTTISADARGTVRPSWELFHAYALNAEKADAYCAAWVNYQRNANAWGEAEAAATDELGYGTLMFATETTEVLTGIDASINDKQDMMNNHVVYDLQGRRVSNAEAKKGLYLINGKKIVVK